MLALAQRAARGKRQHPEIARWLLDPWPQLAELERELRDETYVPSAPRQFVIHEPKRRVISALPFRDRIVQHFLFSVIRPRWWASRASRRAA
ncbi:MAG: hypothetical protein JW751_31845 [Polyangiaceae bacterium]|nr:hypothetical protein [Polyangiaceae bacterium]